MKLSLSLLYHACFLLIKFTLTIVFDNKCRKIFILDKMSNPNPNQSPKKSGNPGKNPENKSTKPESKPAAKSENPPTEGGGEKSKADLRRERNRIQV